MSSRSIGAFAGLLVGATVDVFINLLAAAIQQRAFADQFSVSSIWWLAGLSVFGLLLGYWLGGEMRVPAEVSNQQNSARAAELVTITRLRVLLSYGKMRGRGIHLRDVLLVGSWLDIDAKE